MPGSSTDFCDNYGQTGLPVGLHGGLVRKESACNAGDPHLIPGSERSPGEENGNPLQYSCLGNPMERGAWQVTVYGVAKELNTMERLNNNDNNMINMARALMDKVYSI